jgi:hypothetical protein
MTPPGPGRRTVVSTAGRCGATVLRPSIVLQAVDYGRPTRTSYVGRYTPSAGGQPASGPAPDTAYGSPDDSQALAAVNRAAVNRAAVNRAAGLAVFILEWHLSGHSGRAGWRMFHRVKVSRKGITAEETVAVLRRDMGDGHEVEQTGTDIVIVRETSVRKARVDIRHKDDGTLFIVQGIGPVVLNRIFAMLLSSGISGRVARAIEQSKEFRDEAAA